jgi:hypothetical protein
MNEPEFIAPSQIDSGPIRNESLSLEHLHQIKEVFDVVGPFMSKSLEQFEIGFMRDPANEILTWRRITIAWQTYHERHLDGKKLPVEDEKQLISALILISTGVEKMTRFKLPLKVGRRLIQCYKDIRKM